MFSNGTIGGIQYSKEYQRNMFVTFIDPYTFKKYLTEI